jgi:2',3'-cyclic-nucleotide 2'-phosphodiesterase/3'-nucleotidase
MKKSINFGSILTLIILNVCITAAESTLEIRIIETTDLHSNVVDFDYYKNIPTAKIGLARTATLIKQARAEVTNSVLVDNGDLIQGSPMGDYIAARGLTKGQIHPVYQAMNTLGYDAANIGNHEFNYGLEFLEQVLSGANFDYLNANIINLKTSKPYFTPYKITNYEFKDQDGKSHNINIGYIGFVPPQILLWDKINLQGKVEVQDIKESAEQWVPIMKAAGADLIIAIPHSGLSSEPYKLMAENSVYYLSQVPDINAITFGHSHALFPGKDFSNLAGVDNQLGTINGVAAVMPGRWGSHIGVIDLKLRKRNNQWTIISSQSEARPIFDEANNKSLVIADQAILSSVSSDHKGTKEFMNQSIGKSAVNMYSFLALIQDDPTVQVINDAQIDYVKSLIQGDPDLQDLPVLSAAAPFKTGGRKNNPSNFTEVDAGNLTFRNASDLYPYPNTLAVLKVTGANIKEWLECSAGLFNQVDTKTPSAQSLINWDGFRSYNFDVIDGVKYQIDISKAAKYDSQCKSLNSKSERIKELTFKDKTIDPNQIFLLVTNNYRAYTGYFSGTGVENVVIQAPDENRTVLVNYIRRQTKLQGVINPVADNNWSLVTLESPDSIPLMLIFETAPSSKAENFIKQESIYPMHKIGTDDIGFALYQVKLPIID